MKVTSEWSSYREPFPNCFGDIVTVRYRVCKLKLFISNLDLLCQGLEYSKMDTSSR